MEENDQARRMTAIVPEFLFSIIEQELRNVQVQLLTRVAKEYDIDESEMVARMLPSKPFHVTPERIHVTRKPAPKHHGGEKDRCQARIWNRGRGGQCTRNTVAKMLCGQHHKEFEKENCLRHGWIHEPPSPKIFGNGKHPKALHVTGL